MTVYVRYQVPVMVEVDLESGRVARVVVDDEGVGEAEEVVALCELSADERSSALEIATAGVWPAWEFGG